MEGGRREKDTSDSGVRVLSSLKGGMRIFKRGGRDQTLGGQVGLAREDGGATFTCLKEMS